MPLDRINDLPEECAKALGLPGAIVIGVMASGDIVIHFHGIDSHMDAVQKLAVAIHAVMGDHDRAVLNGAAGAEAQARFRDYEDRRARGEG